MKVREFLKNVEVWKIVLMISFLIIFLVAGGYTVQTKWGSIFRVNVEEQVTQNIVKIKAQYNYSQDMKISIIHDLGILYKQKLKVYITNNKLNISPEKIEGDVQYYQLIIGKINEVNEDITVHRFIFNNNLYRYKNRNDWEIFKKNVIDLYIREGKNLTEIYYDNSKCTMPLWFWLQTAGRELVQCVTKNADKLLEDLKMESVIYHQKNGKK